MGVPGTESPLPPAAMPTSTLRRAVSPLLALLIAGLAQPVSADPQEEARALVNAKARVLFMKHRRAIKALEGTLRNPAFKTFFMAESPGQRDTARTDIEQSMLKVQRYFAIEEMCLIDRDGHEHVRMVGGRLDDRLSDAEQENPFFAPAFALPEGEVLVSDVYVSPDNGHWVLAYVTPIAVRGDNVGLLHYEQEVVSVAGELSDGLSDGQVILAFDGRGRLLIDSRAGEAVSPPDGGPLPTSFDGLALAELEAAAEAGTPLDGRAIATKRVRGWTLVAMQG